MLIVVQFLGSPKSLCSLLMTLEDLRKVDISCAERKMGYALTFREKQVWFVTHTVVSDLLGKSGRVWEVYVSGTGTVSGSGLDLAFFKL